MDSRIFRHPTVCFVYFASVICFSMILINPVCLAISMISSVLTVIIISKSKALGFMLPVLLFSVLISAAVNVLFNHRGATIISYFPDGNPLTFESLMYGAAASIILLSVICWFHCLNKRFTSEKIIYVFGSVIPSLSLMFSIALGFVPKLKTSFQKTSAAQKTLGNGLDEQKLFKKFKNFGRILSAVVSASLENAVGVSESMKSRGYGLKGRTFYGNYFLTKSDWYELLFFCAADIYIAVGKLNGAVDFAYFPALKWNKPNIYSMSVFAVYFLLFFAPVFSEFAEAAKWKRLKSEI